MPPSQRPPELTQELFNTYNTELQGAALKATRNAVFLPADLAFYRSLDRGIAKDLDASSSRVLSLANRLIDLVSTADNAKSKSKGKARLEHDDIADNFRSSVVDSMDQLLERADICLDEVLGLVRQPAIAVNPKSIKQKKANTTTSGRLDPVIQHASHLAKPQLKFKRKADNSDSAPWRPNLRHKYNAKVPLGYDMRYENEAEDASSSLHPYRHEIKHIEYPVHMFCYADPIAPKSFEETPFNWVADASAFAAMLEKLRGAQEIAIDLEYHSYRSFYGFVCLMQLSTREEDFVVDTLAVREELEELNEVFTNPAVVKVLHGAESDIIWLQQDFNLYIVNLFDTYHASKVLDFPRHSLATLMEMYCDFIPDKRYQLADWRIRPLPDEMLHYARSDTHFLLFIYDHLRNALLDRAQSRAQSPSNENAPSTSSANPSHALVRIVLTRSEETSLRVCEREVYDSENGSGPGGWDTLARKWNKGTLMAGERETASRRIYRAVHAWRDRVAREEDESTRYVLPNHYLFVLAEQPPADIAALLSMFQHVPPVVRRRAKELFDDMREAARQGAVSVPLPTPAAPHVAPDVMQVDSTPVESATEDKTSQDATLWPAGPSGLVAPLSALFGNAVKLSGKARASGLFVASRSTLFAVRGSSSTDIQQTRFRDVVSRIHDSLSIAPRAPTLPESAATSAVTASAKAEEATGEDEAVAGQAAIPFVPATERQQAKRTVIEESAKDSIVVVGQAQRKKRKRVAGVKVEKEVVEMEGQSSATAAEDAFDYSAVGNILDEGSDHEAGAVGGGTRKRRQKAQGRFEYGNFRAPPKAHSEVKSGNQSRTFK